jgi:large subunit ribosomal protein L30
MAANPKSTVRIIQRRSPSGVLPNQRHTLRTLGLRGIGRAVERPDSPELRGMIRTVEHLVEVSSAEQADSGKAGADA